MKITRKLLAAPLVAVLCLSGCVNVVTDASTTSVTNNSQTNVSQVQSVNGEGAVQSAGSNPAVTEISPDELLRKVIEANCPFASGWSESTGIWMISRQKIRLTDNMTNQEAINIAEIRAKQKIAEFLGSNITAKESLFLSVEKVNDEEKVKENYSSFICTDVNQFLRGVTLLKAVKKDGAIYASFYVTSRMIDATQQMERELRKAPPGTVQTSGYAVIVDNRISPAKQAALQLALRNAIEQVMGTTVVGQSSLMNNEKVKSKVLSQSMGTVKSYRIVKEGVCGINYQVIAVSEVDKDSLLKNYTSLVRSMGNPGFFINTEDPDLRTALSGFMRDLGFKVSADPADSHFVVDAGCTYLEITDEHYGKGIQIDLHIRLMNRKSGEIYFSMQNKPRLTSTFSGTFHQIRQEAARKAFKTIRKSYHENLNKVIVDWVTNGREIDVVFNNCSDDAQYAAALEKAINNIPGAKILGKSKDGSRIVFKSLCIGSTADFEDFLREAMESSFGEGASLPKTEKIELDEIVFDCSK